MSGAQRGFSLSSSVSFTQESEGMSEFPESPADSVDIPYTNIISGNTLQISRNQNQFWRRQISPDEYGDVIKRRAYKVSRQQCE